MSGTRRSRGEPAQHLGLQEGARAVDVAHVVGTQLDDARGLVVGADQDVLRGQALDRGPRAGPGDVVARGDVELGERGARCERAADDEVAQVVDDRVDQARHHDPSRHRRPLVSLVGEAARTLVSWVYLSDNRTYGRPEETHDLDGIDAGRSSAAVLAGCVADDAQVRTDELSLRAHAHDASHLLLRAPAVVAPRNADEVARLLRATAAAGVPLTFRAGGTSLSGQAGGDGVLVDVRRHFQRHRGARRRRARAGPAGRHGAAAERAARAVRPQVRPGPGQRGRLHDRRGRREQLLGHGLRDGREQLPHARVPGRGPAVGHGHRHRARGRRRPAARARARAVRGPARAASSGPGRPRLAGDDRPAVRDEEHHGLRHQRAGRLRRRRRRSSRTSSSAARGRSPSSRRRPSARSRCARTPRRHCWSSTTSRRRTGRCPTWWPPVRRRSS